VEYLFAWQNLIFFIPLVIGVLLVFGAALGFGMTEIGGDMDHDLDHDIDCNVDHDVDLDVDANHDLEHDVTHGHGETFLSTAMSVLGIGRVPLTILIMLALLIFGGLGVMSNMVLEPLISLPIIYGLVSLGIAFFGMLFLTGQAARLLARIMPTNESYNVTARDFIGVSGRAVTSVSAASQGTAQIRDHEGNVHNVQCVTDDGIEIAAHDDIVVMDYDNSRRMAHVLPRSEALVRLGVNERVASTDAETGEEQ